MHLRAQSLIKKASMYAPIATGYGGRWRMVIHFLLPQSLQESIGQKYSYGLFQKQPKLGRHKKKIIWSRGYINIVP